MDKICLNLKRKCNIDEKNIKQKKIKYENCFICNDRYYQLSTIKLNCGHYVHRYCILHYELKKFIMYSLSIFCKKCNKEIEIDLNIKTKKDILDLTDTYFNIYCNILKNCELKGRAYYEYKRNIFYIITKKIEKYLNCVVEYKNNIDNIFIIKANNIYENDLIITQFECKI